MNKVLEDYYSVREKHDEALGKLETETQRIVTIIKKIFKMGKDVWWAYNYYENAGPLPRPLEDNKTTFPIFIEGEADSGEWDYSNGFPVKFFDMTDQEIIDYLQKEIAKNMEREAKEIELQKKKAELRKKKKAKLIETAAKKLTKEEKKALGI